MHERTLVLLKPDAVEQGLEHAVIFEISRLGLRVVRRRKMRLDAHIVEQHYRHHADKPFFPGLLAYMTRSPVVAMVVEGEEAISRIRELAGATDPAKAAPGTLRARFGCRRPDGGIENVVHASERLDEAEDEIRRFFGSGDSWWRRLRRWFLAGDASDRASL